MPELFFVGTGDTFGSGGRRNSAILVRGRKQTMLLDCGPTTLVGLNEVGIDPLDIDVIAISHFHGDHSAGLPFLLLGYLFERPRQKPLTILGPPGIEARVDAMNQVFEFGEELPFPVSFTEFDCAGAISSGEFTLTPFPAMHQLETRPHMMRVEVDGKAIFFSGDTGWHEALPGTVGDVDLFICEATLIDETFEYHLSCTRLQRERQRFDCRRMILTHLGREVLDNLGDLQFETAYDGLSLKP